MGLELRLDQQRRDGLPDLLQAAFEQRHRPVRQRFPAAVPPIGAQRGKHAAEWIVDLVRDAGGQPPQCREAFRRHHLPLDLALLPQVPQHRAELVGETPDLVTVADLRQRDLLRRDRRDLGQAVGQVNERRRDPAPPGPSQRDQREQHQDGGPDRAAHVLVERRQEARAWIDEDHAPQARSGEFDGHHHQQAVARVVLDGRRTPTPAPRGVNRGRVAREPHVLEPREDRKLLGPARHEHASLRVRDHHRQRVGHPGLGGGEPLDAEVRRPHRVLSNGVRERAGEHRSEALGAREEVGARGVVRSHRRRRRERDRGQQDDAGEGEGNLVPIAEVPEHTVRPRIG